MTDIELEQLTANLCTKSVADIGSLASDAFVGHGMRDDGDSMVVLHAIVVQLLRELAPLRALREAAQYVCDCWQIDSDNEHAVVPFGPASMLQDMLAAWDGGSVCMGQDIGGRVVSESQTKLRRKLRAALDADGAKMWHEGYKAGWTAGIQKGFQEGWEGCEKALREGAVTIMGSNSTIEAKASGENR